MARQYKVKRYYSKQGSYQRPKPRLLSTFLFILLFAGLGYVGTIVYGPVYEFVMNIGKPVEIIYNEPEIEEPSSSVPEEPKPEEKPELEKFRAVYLPFETACDDTSLDEFIKKLDGTKINAVMVDIKNSDGTVLFKTENETAKKWEVTDPKAYDLKQLSLKLKQAGKHLIVKMSVFRDPKAASAGRLDYAVIYQDSGYLWLDAAPESGGKPWLNPYSEKTLDYLNSLALEAIDLGAEMLVLEDVQFPDNSAIYATFGPNSDKMNRSEALRAYIETITGLAEKEDVRVAVYYPAIEVAREQGRENCYGGSPLKIPDSYMLLGVQPSQFGSGYNEAGLEIKEPLQNPSGVVSACVNYAKQGVSPETEIIPLLQGGNDLPFNDAKAFGDVQIEEQIEAADKLGLREYILYSASGEYFLPR